MPTRDAAPSDLKDPEVTQQNLPKGETWDENEWATDFLLVTWKFDMMADRWKDRNELKERHLTQNSVLGAPRKDTSHLIRMFFADDDVARTAEWAPQLQ